MVGARPRSGQCGRHSRRLLVTRQLPPRRREKSISHLAYVRRDVVCDSLELVTGKRHLSTERTPSLRRLIVPKEGAIRSVENAANSDLSEESGHPFQRFSLAAENQRKLRHIEVQILGGSMVG